MRAGVFILMALAGLLLTGCLPDAELEQQIESVNRRLETLPRLQPNPLCPTIGFRSALAPQPDHTTWLDIVLPQEREIDTVVLIPALLRNPRGELETLGFPLRFAIETWLEERPESQHAAIGDTGWMYQAIGRYDAKTSPPALDYALSLNQSLNELASAPLRVSLYHAQDFEPADDRDVHQAPGVTRVGTHLLPAWRDWAAATNEQSPRQVQGRFDLSGIPDGSMLFLRFSGETGGHAAPVDDITLSPPYSLINGDFETPPIGLRADLRNIPHWYDNTGNYRSVFQGAHWASPSYQQGEVVLDHTRSDFPNPGAAPVVFQLPSSVRAKKVRIRATRLQAYEEEGIPDRKGYHFALNEVFLFEGDKNVALNARVGAADQEKFRGVIAGGYAVDGYSYFPPIDPAQPAPPSKETIEADTENSGLMFDLGRRVAPDEIRFYPVEKMPQFSQAYSMGIGFPRRILIRISDRPDPVGSETILHQSTIQQIGFLPSMYRLRPQSGRYVWINLVKDVADPHRRRSELGLSEIELFHNGTNLIAGIEARNFEGKDIELRHLTDQYSSAGHLRPLKDWLLRLEQRAKLEREKEGLLLQREQVADTQKRRFKLLQFVLVVILTAVLLLALLSRILHRRDLRKLRERIGANLHDEVGANLSSIALSSETLTQTGELASPLAQQLVGDITRVAQETATEVRLLSHFLEKQNIESTLVSQFHRIEQQMLPMQDCEADYRALEQFNILTPTEKWELVLFFKEALHNIAKHANASQVQIRTHEDRNHLYLDIRDNGEGIPDGTPSPAHLDNRARKLDAELSIHSIKGAGTQIHLSIPKHGRGRT